MLTLCGFSASNYYNKVKLALLEKGLPFTEELAWVGETDRSASPLGKVPYLRTPQGPLCESAVIADYIEAAHPDHPLIPADPYQAAKVRELITFLELHLELVARNLYPQAFFGGTVSDTELIEALLESSKNYGYVQRQPIDAQLAGWRLNAAALDWCLIADQPQTDSNRINQYFRTLYLGIADLLRRPSHPLFDFEAGYVKRALDRMPSSGPRAPWRQGMNYIEDVITMRHRAIDDGVLQFHRTEHAQPGQDPSTAENHRPDPSHCETGGSRRS